MSHTGHEDFDLWKDEFSATVRDIEVTMHKWATASNNTDNNKQNTSELIRKASSILTKLSSVAKSVVETKEAALKQELLDIYEACKMQLKTYRSLQKQTELFENSNTTNSTSIRMSTSERTILFATRTTTRGSIDNASKCNKIAASRKNYRDQITSRTQGRVDVQNSRLRDALTNIKESEQAAQEISGELERQREPLKSTQGRMAQFSSMTEHSKNLLNSMNRSWWRKW